MLELQSFKIFTKRLIKRNRELNHKIKALEQNSQMTDLEILMEKLILKNKVLAEDNLKIHERYEMAVQVMQHDLKSCES